MNQSSHSFQISKKLESLQVKKKNFSSGLAINFVFVMNMPDRKDLRDDHARNLLRPDEMTRVQLSLATQLRN